MNVQYSNLWIVSAIQVAGREGWFLVKTEPELSHFVFLHAKERFDKISVKTEFDKGKIWINVPTFSHRTKTVFGDLLESGHLSAMRQLGN